MEATENFPRPPGDQHKSALERESSAWRLLVSTVPRANGPDRVDTLDTWFQAAHELRDSQSLLTAASVHRATESMRESASVLMGAELAGSGDGTYPGIAANPVLRAPPQAGRRYAGRRSVWTVVSIAYDELEPHLYLAQLLEDGAGPEGIVDVYSEDWPLFCVVHGLRNL